MSGAEPGTRLLIVNADDFGLTPGVNEGILRAHRDGVVTSTSALAVARSFEAAAPALRDSGIGVGVHFALIGEDPPLLSEPEIPTLVTGRGFRRSWREFLVATAAGRVDADDLRRELGAQLDRITGAGIRPTHFDSHQHLHLLGPVAAVLFELGERAGVRALRAPRGTGRAPTSVGVRRLGSRLASRARARGFRTPDGFAGLEQSGHLTSERWRELLDGLARSSAASIEVGVHPGVDGDPDRARFEWGFEWSAELTALCAPDLRRQVHRYGFRLGTFADL